ncbi:MAG: hypothetical protein ACO1O6_12065 [Bacteroidota bacterium]
MILSALSSCTIQKRTVNKGYFVQWSWQKYKPDQAMKQELPQEEADLASSPEIQQEERGGPGIQNEANAAENVVQHPVLSQDRPEAAAEPEGTVLSKEEKTAEIKETPQKSRQLKSKPRRNLLDDFALLYVIIAGILLLLAVIFLLIGLNVGYIVNTIFFVLAVSCFAGALLVLAFALLLWLFSNSFRQGRKNRA